jgi:prepilin-type processing-associated H-X9-DG protein
MQCVNNLKQLGLATHNYLSAHDTFPPLYSNWQPGPSGWPLGWAVALLPMMEQQALFNSANYSFFAQNPQNTTLSLTLLNVLVCPSESTQVGPYWVTSWTNYAANFGGPAPIMAWSGAFTPMANDAMGVSGDLYANGNVGKHGIASVTDGTSTTAAFSEKLVGLPSSSTATVYLGGASGNSLRVSYQVGSITLPKDTGNAALALQFIQACKSLPATTPSYGSNTNWHIGANWSGEHGQCLKFNSYDHFNSPNGITCIDSSGQTEIAGDFTDALTPTSNHPGGINVGFCDGSVKFIKNTINLPTWWALGSRNLSEVISSDAY